MGTADNFCLRWNDFESNISASFMDIRKDEEFFDVTLCCDEGNSQLQAHKIILAACSPFFRKILSRNHHQNPLIYLKGVDYANLAAVLNFMYHGEVNVAQDELSAFLRVAEELAVKGLTDNKKGNTQQQPKNLEQPKKVLKRPPPLMQQGLSRPLNNPSAPTSVKRRKSEASSLIKPSSHLVEAKIDVKPELDLHHIQQQQQLGNNLNENDDSAGPSDGVFDESATAAEMDDNEEYGYDEMSGDGADFMVPDGSGGDANEEHITIEGMTDEADGSKATINDFIMRNAQGTYWCKGCGHHSSSRRDLSRHIEAKHISGDYRCDICDKSLTTKYNLQRHINKTHKSSKQQAAGSALNASWPILQ